MTAQGNRIAEGKRMTAQDDPAFQLMIAEGKRIAERKRIAIGRGSQ